MTSSNVFVILLLSFSFYQSIKSQSTTLLNFTASPLNITDSAITTPINQTDSTTLFFNATAADTTTISSSTTIKPTLPLLTTTLSSTVSSTITSTNQTATSAVDAGNSSQPSSGYNWVLVVSVIIIMVVFAVIGIIIYHRNTPYRRFLRNWRARDNEADNIILQLEQPEIVRNDQWPSQLSFN